jgi:hypothetical protein
VIPSVAKRRNIASIRSGGSRGNAGMPDMRPIDLAPAFADNKYSEERNASVAGHNHSGIQHDVAAGEGIDPPRDGPVHLYRSLSLP